MLRPILFLILILSSPAMSKEIVLKGAVISMHPWGFVDNGTIKGRHPDLLQELEKRTGIKLTYSLIPLKRISLKLENSTTDFAAILLRDQFRDKVHIVEEIEDLSLKLLMRKDIPVAEMNRIKKMGILLGEKKMLQPHFTSKSIYPKSLIQKKTFFQLFDLLRVKRVDAVVYLGDALDRYLKKNGVERGEFGGEIQVLEKKAYFYLNKNLRDLEAVSEKLKGAISSMKRDGTLQEINSRSFPLPR